MGKMKQLIMDHRGYMLKGHAKLLLWDDTTTYIEMLPVFISDDKFSHGAIKRNINDGGFGCKRIISAQVNIFDVYGTFYETYNRTITLDEHQCKEAMTGPISNINSRESIQNFCDNF